MRYGLLLFFSGLLFSFPVFAADYYVSPSGSNSNPGTMAAPWSGIQYGMNNLVAGDVLHVMTGTFHEKVQFNLGGAPGANITVTGEGYSPVLDGTGLAIQPAMVEISGHSYISVVGLEICNNVMNDAQGILVEGNCQGITLKNNRIHDIHFSSNPNAVATAATNAQAIIVFGSDASQAVTGLSISGNEVYNCRLGYSEGIAVNGNVDGFDVFSNQVHDLTNIGIVAIGHEETCPDPLLDQARNGKIYLNKVWKCQSPYAACGGIYIDGAKDVAITGNSCYENDYGIEIGCEHPGKSASGITVRNNISRNNGIAGIAFGGYDYPSGSGKVMNSTVYNNTLYKNDTLYDGNGEMVITYFENCKFENNIFFTNHQSRAITIVDNIAGVFFDYNLYCTPTGDQEELIGTSSTAFTLAQFQATGEEEHSLYGNPLFDVSPLDDNSFALLTGSPAINGGNPAYAPLLNETDFFSGPRLQGSAVDIGASEHSSLGLAENELQTLLLSPNPAGGDVHVVAEGFDSYVIFSSSGMAVNRGSLNNGELNTSDLPAGMYTVQLTGSGKKAQSRLVKL